MSAPETLAGLFARTVELFPDPRAKDELKVQFRALYAQVQRDGAAIRVTGSEFAVNGTPVADPACAGLLQRLEVHGVGAIEVAAGLPPAAVFELLRALADPPGPEDIPTRLAHANVSGVRVRLAAAPEVAAPTPPEPLVTHDIDPPPAAPASVPTVEAPLLAPDQSPEAVRPPPDVPLPQPARPGAAGDAADELERNPRGPQVSELLATLGRQVEAAQRGGRLEQVLKTLAVIVRCEQQVPEGSLRRQYAIALKRMFTKALVQGVAQLLGAPQHQETAVLVLRRAGADAVEVLLDLLVAAPTIGERHGIFSALTHMKEGSDQLVHMLEHHQWFVVRNVAELVGELGLEEAVPVLAKQLEHSDERVRKAVALALAKIGTRSSAEPIRRALRDKSPGVRMQAALGVGGRKSSALAMPLVVAMEEERDPDVSRELILALGRIASADAVQALIKFAQPAGRLFSRRPSAVRVAAVEALRLAATPAAVGMLQGLTRDGDKHVREAAEEALIDLKKA